jgi:predicted nucleic acid-binding protein
MTTVIDTDALLGIFRPGDPHHLTSLALLDKLFQRDDEIFLLSTTLAEFALLASSRIGIKETKKSVKLIMTSNYPTLDITEGLTAKAVELYYGQTSKEESLFDCYVMAAAWKIHADYIFSFDKGYEKNGFMLAKDFLKGK